MFFYYTSATTFRSNLGKGLIDMQNMQNILVLNLRQAFFIVWQLTTFLNGISLCLQSSRYNLFPFLQDLSTYMSYKTSQKWNSFIMKNFVKIVENIISLWDIIRNIASQYQIFHQSWFIDHKLNDNPILRIFGGKNDSMFRLTICNGIVHMWSGNVFMLSANMCVHAFLWNATKPIFIRNFLLPIFF